MAFPTTFANDAAKLLFQGTAIANLCDNAASSPLTSLYVTLHTSDPSAGNQTTNEVSVGSMARVAVARTSSGFTISGNTVTLTAAVSFPAPTSGSALATHFSIGTASSGTGKLLAVGPITPNISIVSGGQAAQLTTATAIVLS
jgi:hypothetical protein